MQQWLGYDLIVKLECAYLIGDDETAGIRDLLVVESRSSLFFKQQINVCGMAVQKKCIFCKAMKMTFC